MADSRESKCLGLSEMIWFMKGRASMAVPSTTSMTTHPTMRYSFYRLVSASTILQAMEPPRECPTTTRFFSGKRCSNSLSTSMVSLQRVSIEKSSLLCCFFEKPCPFRSKARRVPKCFTSFASVAKLSAEWPAPWMQKKITPSLPAWKTEVP
jgi:hypothetical protein